MKGIQKCFLTVALAAALLGVSGQTVFAIGILPTVDNEQCRLRDEKGNKVDETPVVEALKDAGHFDKYVQGDRAKLEGALGCAVKLGKIRLFMMPYFITFLIQFLLTIAGLIAVLFVVYGGYQYVVGGLTEDKESGKKTITHALIGLLVALSAWIVVNFIQVALTS